MKKDKRAGNKTRDWIMRVVIFGTLGIVLVLAVMDNRAKRQANETGIAWRDLLPADDDMNAVDLPLAALKGSMQGSPEVTESEGQNTYTWKGQFRSYTIKVGYNTRSVDKSVEVIEGP